MLSGTILTVIILSAVFAVSTNRHTQAIADRALLLPVASPAPNRDRSELQTAALARFTGLFNGTTATLTPPVRDFMSRVTKKQFGMYITPETSPVDHDRFTGYHTGVDVEFTDTDSDVPVYAIADGSIVFRDWVKGYGGVIVIRHTINGVTLYALYGHLDEASFPPTDVVRVVAGQQIARLGDGLTQETDGVRKHLHFSVSTTEKLDLRGYVQDEAELSHWLNPLDFYPL